MQSILPQTGTAALLDVLSPFVPDELINSLCVRASRRGRPNKWSPAQLYRILLLPLLTPARSYNLVVALLKEQRAWRRFAGLRNRQSVPDVTLVHDFRHSLGVSGLRRINTHLLKPLLTSSNLRSKTVALIDSTDLPAATGNNYKKNTTAPIRRSEQRRDGGHAKADRASSSLVTRSTRCAFGSTATLGPFS